MGVRAGRRSGSTARRQGVELVPLSDRTVPPSSCVSTVDAHPHSSRAPLADEDGVRAAAAPHGGELYRAACRLTGDAHHAEELVQETFLRAWRAADRFDERIGSLRTWLFGILRNLAIDHARAEAVRPLRAVGPAVVATTAHDTTADEIDRVLLAWQVEEALRQISVDHRRVLVEVHLRGRGIADVACRARRPGRDREESCVLRVAGIAGCTGGARVDGSGEAVSGDACRELRGELAAPPSGWQTPMARRRSMPTWTAVPSAGTSWPIFVPSPLR